MSEKLGVLTYGPSASSLRLDASGFLPEARAFSEETARAIDHEVRAIVEAEHARAAEILNRRKQVLETIADRLLAEETLERGTLEAMVQGAAGRSVDHGF